ncbi:imidazole glycerol phosphate synthase, glutamine amidotransferase subunit [Candidatus Gottesmanbacteria bacterium RIFCSPHIGHO2_01_FULL_39_10]|uniref:Imidazole glycerol phosphate synthase subunit HisH n=1 Tax=Candidatus Gottesmanbacteria bacterium RIFCSPHIGHO2_01_FULL_39_10 TaxID=1798375 RepID=A0A1F5ZQC4_9BACT|nr:MAG: imidazole glycerol phosphate synthase, glutamine amidotransferase subunit [Candidatus Gottesmanbacteria bacterium RIFCSPHIGHO2_01_FULL_39_10]
MITIIDYGIGNLGSVANALDKLGARYQISSQPKDLRAATSLILPGVGAASEGMRNLKERNIDKVLIEEIDRGKPFLGICLGMQLLFDNSEEGNIKCLSILEGKVKKFQKEKKIPQIGWNSVEIQNSKVKNLFLGIPDNSYLYFVNSYYCIPADKSIIIGETEYGETFPSVIVKENIMATQFHPEKSGKAGFQLLKNFINYVN